jgi:RNA 2',3'-cyclic 3'-phosphodiesterase
MPRLFIAIDIPQQIKDVLTQFARELPAARWVPADQIHLTLRFIGEVGPQTFDNIKSAISCVRFPEFTLTLRGSGHFPPGKHPRVLWIGLEPSSLLMKLQQDLELALMEAGLAPEERRFSPHITVARLKDSAPDAASSFEERHADLAFAPFPVRAAVLYSSVLTNRGAIHSKEALIYCQDAP